MTNRTLIKQPAICLLIFLFSMTAYGGAPDAAVNVTVAVDNGANTARAKTPSDFRFAIVNTQNSNAVAFRGNAAGTVVPVERIAGVTYSVRVESTFTGYIPVMEGFCDPDGVFPVIVGQITNCRITMYHLSFNEGRPLHILKVKKEIDNTSTSGEPAPVAEDFMINISRGSSFNVAVPGSAAGFNIGLESYDDQSPVQIVEQPNTSFPNYKTTYGDGCSPSPGFLIECVVTSSFVNREIGGAPDAILNVKSRIGRHDPNGGNLPMIGDLSFDILDSSNRRLLRFPGSEAGVNIGINFLGAGSEFTVQAARTGLYSNYLPIIECDAGQPVEFRERKKRECTIDYFVADERETGDINGIIKARKQIVNAGLPSETNNPSSFRLAIQDSLGNVISMFDGSAGGYYFGRVRTIHHTVVELPSTTFPNYVPVYNNPCLGQFFDRRGFRECVVTNYSTLVREQGSNAVIGVTTSIDSTGDPSASRPRPEDFLTRILDGFGTQLLSFPGSGITSYSGVLTRGTSEFEVRVENYGFPNYFPTYSIGCLRLPLARNQLRDCLITMVYSDKAESTDSSNTINIKKVVSNSADGPHPQPGEFSIGVYNRAGQFLMSLNGSSEGETVRVRNSMETFIREINPPPDYLPLYSSDCNHSTVIRGTLGQCVITNVYIGDRPPAAHDQLVSTAEDIARPITLTATDVHTSNLSYLVVSPPTRGTLSGVAPNLVYTPHANYNGPDSFSFRASDGQFDSAPATVSINITPANDAPTASGQSVSTITETSTPIILSASDVDGDSLTATIVTGPSNGTVTLNGLSASYVSNINYTGTDSFTFRVFDGVAFSNNATVTLSVANGISIGSVSKTEGNSGINQYVFNVELLAPSLSNVTVNYTTSTGNALSGVDFTGRSGTVTFVRGGPLIMPVTIDVFGEQLFEPNETFRLNFSSPVNAVLRNSFATGTIVNDDIQVGIASMSPEQLTVSANEKFTIALTWIHPERWRLLDEIEFRIVDDQGTAMWVKFEENGASLPFRQFNIHNGQYGEPVLPGADVMFNTNTAKMYVAESTVIGSGPTGPSATLNVRLGFKPMARGRTFRVELFVTDDFGNQQGFDHVGNITVRP